MQSVMEGCQQLLPLLTVSVASAANVSAAVADLQRRAVSLQGSSADAAAHLAHVQATVEAMAASNATSVDVERCMADLKDSLSQLHEDGTRVVLEGYAQLQSSLGWGIAHVQASLDGLVGDVAEVSADVKEVKAYPLSGATLDRSGGQFFESWQEPHYKARDSRRAGEHSLESATDLSSLWQPRPARLPQ